MKRATWPLLVVMAIGSLVVWESTSGASNPAADRRYERTRTFSPPWKASCGPHDCGVPTILELPVETPTGVVEVDVVATLTLDHRTTPSDWGLVETSFRRGGPATSTQMNPGTFPIMSATPGRFSTTTLVWVKRNVPAGGRDYRFEVSVSPRRGDRNPDVTVQGRRLSFVVEMTESDH